MLKRPRIKRWLRTAVADALVVAAVYFLMKHLAGNWHQVAPSLQHIRLGYAVAAFPSTLIMLLLASWSWTLVMRWVGVPLGGWAGLRIYYRSSILRYLPGSLWYLPGRAYLCQQQGVSLSTFAGGTFLELFFLIATAGMLGGIAVSMRFGLIWLLAISLICLSSVALALLWPERLQRLVLRGHNVGSIQRRGLLAVILADLGAWFMYGTSVSLLLLALGVPTTVSDYAYVICASTAAWTIGFLSLVPTGLGIREASLAGLLRPLAPVEQIVMLGLLQRTIEIFLEGCLWLAIFCARWWEDRTRS
jgi:uncharacterized membrane protein YbhN (UPF0104 family)